MKGILVMKLKQLIDISESNHRSEVAKCFYPYRTATVYDESRSNQLLKFVVSRSISGLVTIHSFRVTDVILL